MTMTAFYPVHDPEEPGKGESITIEAPQDVDTLVTHLSDARTGTATLHHSLRAPMTDALGLMGPPGATTVPDHVMLAGVFRGFGYLEYVDSEHELCQPAGSPESPVYHSDSAQFNAGTGIPVEVLSTALKEFLVTAQRPTCVRWQDA